MGHTKPLITSQDIGRPRLPIRRTRKASDPTGSLSHSPPSVGSRLHIACEDSLWSPRDSPSRKAVLWGGVSQRPPKDSRIDLRGIATDSVANVEAQSAGDSLRTQ